MKNIIKTAICLIVISSILLYSFVSNAAQSDFSVIYPTGIRYATLVSTYVGSTDNNYQSTADYEVSTNIAMQPNLNDGYYTGYYRFQIECTPNLAAIPTGWSWSNSNVYFEGVSDQSNNYRVVSYSISGQKINILVFFDNYPCFGDYLNLGMIKWNFGLYNSSGNANVTVPSGIQVNFTYTYTTSNKNFTAIPQTQQGYGLLYKQFITDALNESELDLVYDYLVLWKTTQDQYLADIELSIDDVELWLNVINSAQATLQAKIDLIYVLEQTFPGYFNSMISLLQQIRDMNASDTAAESQMQNAEQQLSQAVNDMEVQKPNINNVVNAGDQYMDSNITGAQGDTFFWLHGTNIFVTILTMAVTIGILGFVIYGKSG